MLEIRFQSIYSVHLQCLKKLLQEKRLWTYFLLYMFTRTRDESVQTRRPCHILQTLTQWSISILWPLESRFSSKPFTPWGHKRKSRRSTSELLKNPSLRHYIVLLGAKTRLRKSLMRSLRMKHFERKWRGNDACKEWCVIFLVTHMLRCLLWDSFLQTPSFLLCITMKSTQSSRKSSMP